MRSVIQYILYANEPSTAIMTDRKSLTFHLDFAFLVIFKSLASFDFLSQA